MERGRDRFATNDRRGYGQEADERGKSESSHASFVGKGITVTQCRYNDIMLRSIRFFVGNDTFQYQLSYVTCTWKTTCDITLASPVRRES